MMGLMHSRAKGGVLLIALVLTPSLFYGAGTASWEMHTYQDFVKGRFEGLSFPAMGASSSLRNWNRFSPPISPQSGAWPRPRMARCIGTGHRGRVFRVDSAGKGSTLWTAPQPEIFAVTVGPDGAVYAGTSPNGRIYRIQSGSAVEYFAPGAKYFWALAFGKDGALYAGTGDEGKIFRITAAGKGELYYDSGQSHITCLTPVADGTLLAGSAA